MNQSSEGKIRSKYESSSRKIKELYNEFQSLKSRINTPSKNKRLEMSFDYSQNERSFSKVESELATAYVPRIPIQKRLFHQTPKINPDFQMQTLLKNSFQKFWTTSLVQLDKKVDDKCNILDDRVQNLKDLLEQLGRLMKIKSGNMKLMKGNRKCNCKWKGEEVQEVEQKYQKKMEQMISTYENKISLLVKQNNTSASSVNMKIPKQVEEELKNLEEKLLIKQKQITELKLQGSRLRRQGDNNSRLLRDKEKLVEELGQEIKDKEHHIKQLSGNVMGKGEKLEKELKFQKKQHEIVVKKLNAQIDRLNEINQILESEVNKVRKTQQDLQNQAEPQRKLSKERDSEWNESEIHHHEIAVSQGDDELPNYLKIEQVMEDFEPLRHSHFVFKNNKNKTYHLEKKIKQLESQLQLISQQNRLLKDKKDKFEVQVKQNQSDEEKFQMQSQILRDELKRMNVSIKNLDECAVMYLKENKVAVEKVERLDEGLNFKKELSRKFPQRKDSVSKSIK